MQNRFVVNGKIQNTQNVVLAYELLEADFKINLHVTDRKELSTEQLAFLQKDWTEGATFEFPATTKLINPDVNADSILPDNIQSEETGKVRHFQNEWAVQLLTNKLWEVYLVQLESLKTKANELTNYSKELFEDTKVFWEQVLENKKERNITQERLDKIKDDVNSIFDKLKTFRKAESEEFDKQAKAFVDSVSAQLEEVKKKVSEKANLKALSDEIKNLQQNVRSQQLSKTAEANLRKVFNDAFHFLSEAHKNYFSNKNESRIAGLKDVISKMEAGLARDKKDVEYFSRKENNPKAHSLELQLLKVKLRQITDTIASKEEKLKDIYRTLESLQKQTTSKAPAPKEETKESAAVQTEQEISTEE